MEMVRKKQMRNRTPINIRKKKLDGASKPSQIANCDRGSGKIAIIKHTSGRKSQAREFFIDKEFLFRKISINANERIAAIDISICRLVIFFPS